MRYDSGLAVRCTADRYTYIILDDEGTEQTVIADGGFGEVILFSRITSIIVHHGVNGWTRLEKTIQGGWMIWESTLQIASKVLRTNFRDPARAIQVAFGGL